MRKLLSSFLLLVVSASFGATLTPIQLLNPAGSTSGQSIISTGAGTAPAWSTVGLGSGVSGILPVANGGIGIGTLTGLALGNGASAFSAYGGTSCTNQFPRSLSASGVATCATVGSGDLAASLSLTTPVLGVATATSINKVRFTAPTTAATFAFGTDNATITLQGTDTYVGRATTDTLTNKTLTAPVISTIINTGTLTLPTSTDTLIGKATTDTLTNKTFDTAGAGNVLKINGTTISANTGTGSNVLATSPTLVTPNIGVATATTVNGNTITSGTGTLTIGAGKTLAANNTLTLAGTDGTTMTFPAASATIARTDAANTFNGTQTLTGPLLVADGTAAAPSYSFSNNTNSGFYRFGSDSISMALAGLTQFRSVPDAFKFRSSVALGWTAGTADGGVFDLQLNRDAANTLAQRNGTNAQTSRLYNTYTDASNGEWLETSWASNAVTLSAKANGTGTVRTFNIASPALTGTPTAPTATAGTNTTQVATTAFVASATSGLLPALSGTSASLGGSALVAGQCSSGTVTITGATTSMVAIASPTTYPGDGFDWVAYVSAANTVTVKVCGFVAGTPTASTYNVRIIQ